MYSLGCIIYELIHLDKYFLNNIMQEVKKIDETLYNPNWQELFN